MPVFPGRELTIPLDERLALAYNIRSFCKLSRSPLPRGYSWSPDDFGQARMAALGWLVSLAGTEQPSRADDVVAGFRAGADKLPADAHAIWNWFYLCAMQLDHAGAFEAGRKLRQSSPRDPLALWGSLHVLGTRSVPLGTRPLLAIGGEYTDPEGDIAPLGRPELDEVLAAWHDLRSPAGAHPGRDHREGRP